MPSYYEAAREVSGLLESFLEPVVRGAVRPILADSKKFFGRSIALGLRDDADWYLILRQSDDSGTLWVGVHDSSGEELERWSEQELGPERVRALWDACRAQLYSTATETAVAGITKWLKVTRGLHP